MATRDELLAQLAVVESLYDSLGVELDELRVAIETFEPPPPPPPPPPGEELQHPVAVGTGDLWFRRSRTLNIFPVTVTAQIPPDTNTNLWRYNIEWDGNTATNIEQGRLGLTEAEVDLPDA